MPKHKKSITGISSRKQRAIRQQERRTNETEEEAATRRLAMAERGRERRMEETEEEAAARRLAMAERGRERRMEETEEEAAARRLAMAERGRERRMEETEEEAAARRLAMAERDRERRMEETEEEAASRRYEAALRAQQRRHDEGTQPLAVRENRLQAIARRRTMNSTSDVGRCGLHPTVEEQQCGDMDNVCIKCGAFFFNAEKNTRGIYTHCCHNGKAILEPLQPYPDLMRQLIDGSDRSSAHFKEHIRSYNSALSFASMGAQITPPPGTGPYCFRIHGQIYHNTSHLHPSEVGQEKYAQLYVLDSDIALRQRMNKRENLQCKEEIMSKLDDVIRRVNPYAHAFQMLHEMEERVTADQGPEAAKSVCMYIRDKNLSADQHRGRYNAPKSNEIAMVFHSSDGAPPTNRDICIYPKGNHLCRINALNPNCDPMTYVLFFPYGEKGWSVDAGCSELQFYSHRLSVRRNVFNPILYGGKLLQQYCVDSYVKVEGNRLNYIRCNQKTLRVESYLGLADHLNSLAEQSGLKPGIMVILPSTFTGSPRAMQQNYQDAMAIVREFGKPDLFVTLTCNPNWREIKENLFPGQKPHDRPDLVARVFDMKKKAMLNDLKKNGILGHTVADIHVIEFQKRGLPHMHLLLILTDDDKIRDPATIDTIVCAELPDPTIENGLHEIVKATMIHGPCGVINPNSPCMEDGVCSKGYPKDFRNETAENIDGYSMYRRRDDGNQIMIKGNVVDNRWVVPYNPYLTKKYNAHVNVEICSSVKSIKYIFKYVYKGHDCANVVFENNGEGSVVWDEVKSYLNARYVSAPEAMWRLLEKPMQDKSHVIIRLPVHLQDMQSVYFREAEEREAFERARNKNTMLTAWFLLNRSDPSANIYLYTEIPKHFVWKGNVWQRRIKLGDYIVSRMYSVSPKDIERFHLRMLLCHVPGAKSFEELRTCENTVHETFKGACRARNLLEDDDEWQHCLTEACGFEMPPKLRQLFSFICVFGNPNSPIQLWEQFESELSEDFARHLPLQESRNRALQDIANHLRIHNMTLQSLGLPEPSSLENSVECDVYDLQEERTEGQRLLNMLNPEQRIIFDAVIESIQNDYATVAKVFCVNAFAGSGKTFLFNTLLHYVRGMGHTAIPVAWTGIAAILLKGGRTAHSQFKLPVPILDNSASKIRQNTSEGKLLKMAKLIIWDECTMTPIHALNAVDRLLRDLVGNDVPFGGKVFILGGDWRQILPVVIHANKTLIFESCIKNSSLWPTFLQFSLVTNMRTEPEELDFVEWLIRLGDGRLTNDYELGEDIIEIPPECLVQDSIVDDIFGSSEIDLDHLSERAILCPKNEDSLRLNEEVLRKVPGEIKSYFSADTILCDDEEEQNNLQMDFINSLTPSGMPPHQLNLKVGVIVMLLRNMNPSIGLCNGTRLIVKRLSQNVIDAEILTGHRRGTRVFIPRVLLTPSDTNLPFQLRRRQFPLRLAFAMTINKSQGQSLKRVGIYLPHPVFSHGMLYVAFSRATSRRCVRVWVKDGPKQGKLLSQSDKVFTQNIVFREVLS